MGDSEHQALDADGPVFCAAGFWRRLAAAAIDLAIILPMGLALWWLGAQVTGLHLPPIRLIGPDVWIDLLLAANPALIAGLVLILTTACVYVMVFQVTRSRTPGMRCLGLRVIDLYGDAPTLARAAARTAGYVACAATFGLGFLWIGIDADKRGLNDWIAGTHVVKV
ncbi:MAG TPA: RDD family protein [Kofleriaceae bacterium]|nr:RDD family protein [Kofleriaceae bacterium]